MQTFPLATYSPINYHDILTHGTTDSILFRQAQLVLKDAYYSKLYNRLMEDMEHQEAVDILINAGCFDDMLEERVVFNTYFMSAPYTMVHKAYLAAKNAGKQKMAVIIATGSFDPLHDGHIESVVKAKEFIESQGSTVIAGFMSPSHDTYVRRKNPGGEGVFNRIHENMVFLENSAVNQPQWIYHENWEATGIDASTNFTDVITYIDGMVKAHVATDVDVYYVFGSDNQHFGLAFDHNDDSMAKGICVGRPGYNLCDEMVITIDNSSTLNFVQGNNGMSSTQVRAEKEATTKEGKNVDMLPFVIRNDVSLSTSWMKTYIPEEELRHKVSTFTSTLVAAFNKSFPIVNLLDVEAQLEYTKGYLNKHFKGQPVLSCDVYLEGDKTLRASRLFDVASSQHHGKTIYYNDDMESINTDKTEYVFVDDDIFSGFFLKEVKEKYNIVDAVSMAHLTAGDFLDIVDARDFIVGGVYGGLMIDAEVPFRVPYLTPFVDLVSRASMPANNIRLFNREIWGANESFYAGTGITVSMLPIEQSVFLYSMGFDKDTTIENICNTYGKSFL